MTYLGTDAGRVYPVHVETDEPSPAYHWRRCPRCDGAGKVAAGDAGHKEYCMVCAGVGGWYENPKDHMIGP